MRTSHSSYYIEREMLSSGELVATLANTFHLTSTSGKTPEAMGLPAPEFRIAGGAFPIWLSVRFFAQTNGTA